MELICRIIDQGALTTRQYTGENGQTQTFTSMPFVLASGRDTFYVEMTGEAAVKRGPLNRDYYYKADISAHATSFKTKEGDVGRKTSLYLNRIDVL